ncbi:hypothetical protein DOTSEDRAFT_20365 [Dothistroma septosporum NZE10]|uniref:Uncharacterized protein n=1 Tax=Dothistroma septosporum (strain NZE10 / CBS 128990) TaxID=675120 RepID=N1Q404_DOTSN|nr:hypothetical protein DOTSEDRAFT_20365 [Dothistroma septosporum NZE10]
MTPAGPDTNNPHAPRSVSESSVITCEHDVNDVDADYQVFSEPIVQVDGELNLTGGWVLRKHVSPKGGDTISIFPERQKGTRANLAESIEKHMNSDETLPRYKGWVYVLEGDKNSIDPVETSTIRGDRLRERQNEGIILRRRGKQTAFNAPEGLADKTDAQTQEKTSNTSQPAGPNVILAKRKSAGSRAVRGCVEDLTPVTCCLIIPKVKRKWTS